MRGILTYHSLDDSGSPISIHPEAFVQHVEWLASGAVTVVPLEDLSAVPDEQDAVAVTFDDGFCNFTEHAWPLLRDAGLPVTLFVATLCVGGTNAWGGVEEPGIPTLPLCDWSQLRAMVAEGLVLGSHSRTHPRLSNVSDGRLADELAGASSDLELRTGVRPRTLCYPYGDLDERVVEAAREHYALGCTTEFRALGTTAEAMLLPRLDAYYWREAQGLPGWGSAAFRRHLWLRGQARGLRARLRGD